MIKKIKKSRNEYKLLFLGLDNAGKTTILHKIFQIKSSKISPTFGYHTHNLTYKNLNLIISDVGGQNSLRKYWSNFYEKLDGIVFVYDIADQREFSKYLKDILEDNINVPVLILANKSDLTDNIEVINVKEDNVNTFAVSGKTGYNLDIAFDWLLERIQEAEIRL